MIPNMETASAHFQQNFGDTIDLVMAGEVVTVTRYGKPKFAMIEAQQLGDLQMAASSPTSRQILAKVIARGAVAYKAFRSDRKGPYFEGQSDVLDELEVWIKGKMNEPGESPGGGLYTPADLFESAKSWACDTCPHVVSGLVPYGTPCPACGGRLVANFIRWLSAEEWICGCGDHHVAAEMDCMGCEDTRPATGRPEPLTSPSRAGEAEAILWAVHAQGPDDIIACRDRQAADELFKHLEAQDLVGHERGLPAAVPVVIPWPFSAEQHAEEIPAATPEGARGGEPSQAQTASAGVPSDPDVEDLDPTTGLVMTCDGFEAKR